MKIPGTAEGLEAIRRSIAEGRSINVTLLFGLRRYEQVIEAYLAGLEELVANGGNPRPVVVGGVVLRVSRRHRRRPPARGERHRRGARAAGPSRRSPTPSSPTSSSSSGSAASAGTGWPPPAPGCSGRCGRRRRRRTPSSPTRSTSTRSSARDTVNTMPERRSRRSRTTARWLGPSTPIPARRRPPSSASRELGIDLEEVAATLEDEGVASFAKSFDELLGTLDAKAADPGAELPSARCTGSWSSSTTSRPSSPSASIEAYHGRPNDGFSFALVRRRDGAALLRAPGRRRRHADRLVEGRRLLGRRALRAPRPRGVELPARAGGAARAGRRRQRQLPDAVRGGARPLPAPHRRARPLRRRSTSGSAPTATRRRCSRARRGSTPTRDGSS